MRRYKTIAFILLMLSVFNSVLAAPVAVREVREAFSDAVDGDDNVTIGLAKHVREEDPLFARAQQEEESLSPDWFWNVRKPSEQGPSSAPTSASGTHPNPSFSSGDGESSVFSASGGTASEPSSNPEGETKLFQPGISTEIQPASSSKAQPVSWVSDKKVKLPSGEIPTLPLQSEALPAPPGREGYLAKMAAQQLPSPNTEYASDFNLPLPPGREAYLAKMAAQQSPSRPSKSFFGDSSNIFNKLRKLKFLPRFQHISSTVNDTVDAAQRKLQCTVDSGRRVRFYPFSKSSIPTLIFFS